jgi:diguanylate cyclase (GGDEF)-like protein
VATLRRAADAAGREASIDPLTGLGNRRAFDLDLARLVDGDQTGGLVLADVDGLKTINDQFGHAMGDVAIRAIAEKLRDGRRMADSTYRIGGDEMALIVVGPGTAGAGRRLERTLTRLPGEGFLVGASIGWAERLPDDTMASLFARADADLYTHKRERRASS